MDGVKWIKITTDIFDDEKILLIESLPEADSIIVIWFKLLCLAGKMNNSGVFMLNDKIAYTNKMLSTIFRRKESTVQLALKTFEQFGMVKIIDGVITIPNWGKHQNLEQMEDRKRYQREYQREYRKKQKLLASGENEGENSDSKCLHKHLHEDLHKPNINSLEGEEEEEEDKEKEIERDIKVLSDFSPEKSPEPHPADIVNLFNSICKSFPQVKQLTENRKKAIKARLRTYTLADFETVFRNAESSAFLKGKNKRNWSATFDWILNDSNFAKILEGNYSDSKAEHVQTMRRMDSDELEAIRQMMGTG